MPYYLPLSDNKKINAILDYLSEHLDEAHTSEAIAKYFAMSAKTMGRLFQHETGMRFSHWHQQLKLINAIELLGNGASTTFVAQSLGYSNDSAFIAMFKRLSGKTPSGFKKAAASTSLHKN